jgi:hypothetical protein
LAGFTAISTDEHWKQAFIDSAAGAVHKVRSDFLSFTIVQGAGCGWCSVLPFARLLEPYPNLSFNVN